MNNCNNSICPIPWVHLLQSLCFLRPSPWSSSHSSPRGEAGCRSLAIARFDTEGQKACKSRPDQTAQPSPQWAQLHVSLWAALQAAFDFSMSLAHSFLHDALMGFKWVFGRKQWHLSSLHYQDSSSEPGPWLCVSSHWPAELLMTLSCSTRWFKLGGSPVPAIESISTSQTKFFSITKQNRFLTFAGSKINTLTVIHPNYTVRRAKVYECCSSKSFRLLRRLWTHLHRLFVDQ